MLVLAPFLQNAIATDVFGVLVVSGTKIPYTDAGAAQLEDAVRGPLEQGVRSGAIAIDFDPETEELLPAYTLETLPVLDVPPAQRALRQGPPITFSARLAGAIHFATVTGTVTPARTRCTFAIRTPGGQRWPDQETWVSLPTHTAGTMSG